MDASDILALLTERGLTLRPLPDGNLEVSPRRALTDELRTMIRTHKASLMAAIGDPTPVGSEDEAPADLRAEARRRRVLATLCSVSGRRYAAITDDADPRYPNCVVVAVGGRLDDGGVFSCQLIVPKERWDGTVFLDLLAKHSEELVQ